jgi:hydrogenase maturation protease
VATLLLGMGNTIVSDDAIGVLLARDLGARLAGTPSLDVIEEGPPGTLDLVERLLGYERVIVIDSIRTRDGRPGTWYSFTAAALRGTTNLRNVHDTNFATALELSRQLGLRLPGDDQIHILAVEILQNDTFGESLSPPLAAAYPQLVDELLAEIRRLLGLETIA